MGYPLFALAPDKNTKIQTLRNPPKFGLKRFPQKTAVVHITEIFPLK